MRTTTRGILAVTAAFALGGMIAGAARGEKKKKKQKSKMPRVSKVLSKTDAKLDGTLVSLPSLSQSPPADDRTLAPYFHVPGADPDTDTMPVKQMSADVRIAGVIAEVEVTQVFENEGSEPIEAVYVFPASTRAAVHGMKMKIGNRTIVAEIQKRAQAKKTYEEAKSSGKKASLLEQERPNVFTMQVANIMPGDRIDVLIEYSEILLDEAGTYEFVFPTVVGPRYGGEAVPASDAWMENPYLHEGEEPSYGFDIDVTLETGLPIRDVRSPSHVVDVDYRTASSARVTLDGQGDGDRDFVLQYRLTGESVDGQVLLYDHGDEKFFMVMLQPPEVVDEDSVLPREFVFLLDVSGSMSGFPLDTSKKLMSNLLSDLGPDDRFNIVTFAGSSGIWSPVSVPATPENVGEAMASLGSLTGGGGTELMDGLQTAYGIPRPEGDVSRTVVVLTDGYVSVESQAFKFIRDRLEEANLFAFGIGTSVNRHLVEGMARAGWGEPFVVLKGSEAPLEAERFRRYVRSPVLTGVRVAYDGFGAYDDAPGEIPDLMAERPLVVFGKWKGKPSGEIVVTGETAAGPWEKKIGIREDMVHEDNAPIRSLWVRKWVDVLSDQLCMLPGDKGLRSSITKLGLHYRLLTPYTSFVAVDTVKSNKTGKTKKVKQPLPLPAGVSDLAVAQAAVSGSSGVGYGSGAGTVKGASLSAYGMGISSGASYKSFKVPKVVSGKATVKGSVSKSAVTKPVGIAVKQAMASDYGTKCPDVSFTGKLVISFDGDGKIDQVVVTISDLDGSCSDAGELEKVLEKAIRKRFGTKPLSGAGNATFTIPIVYNP